MTVSKRSKVARVKTRNCYGLGKTPEKSEKTNDKDDMFLTLQEVSGRQEQAALHSSAELGLRRVPRRAAHVIHARLVGNNQLLTGRPRFQGS